MKKYRTLGEFLQFISDIENECTEANIYFTIRGCEKNLVTFAIPSVMLSCSYSDELLASPIDLVEIRELEGINRYYNVILKVLD